MKVTDLVQHGSKTGRKGIVESIDTKTYSITLIIWRDTDGNGCANLESELTVIKSL